MHANTHESQLPKELMLNLASQLLLKLLHLLSDLSVHLLHVLPHCIILLWCIQPAEHNMFSPSKPQICQPFVVVYQTKVWHRHAASTNMPDTQCETCYSTLKQVLQSGQGL